MDAGAECGEISDASGVGWDGMCSSRIAEEEQHAPDAASS